MNKKLLLIDLSNFIFRAYYAITPLTSPDGTPVNAVYGIYNMLKRLIDSVKPTHILVAQDTKGGSFRKEMYPEYKANRGAPPDDLIPQFDLIEELVHCLDLPVCKMPGFEADDIIGSAIIQFKSEFNDVFIASGDKDLMQFVDEKVKMIDTMKNVVFGITEVKDKMGVYPHQIVDYLSLLGDASDNIPGVRGIGKKGAEKLLIEYENLDNILKNVETITTKRVKNALLNSSDSAILSKKLITIKVDINLNKKLDELSYDLSVNDNLISFLKKLGFNSLINKLNINSSKLSSVNQKDEPTESVEKNIQETNLKTSNFKYVKVQSSKTVEGIFNFLSGRNKINITIYNEIIKNQKHFFVCITDLKISSVSHYFIFYDKMIFDNFFKIIILNANIEIYSFDFKSLLASIDYKFEKINATFFDLSQLRFVNNPGNKLTIQSLILSQYNFSLHYLYSDQFKKDNKVTQEDMLSDIELEEKIVNDAFICSQAIINICKDTLSDLSKNETLQIYNDLDSPLIPILAKMESRGILIDQKYFQKLENNFQSQIDKIKKEIFETAGIEINLNSPKQVSELLFEKMNLPTIKKTKTGFSTSQEVMEKLEAMNISPIPKMIIKYRELDKLLSTYVKVIPRLINNETQRVHTHFKQNNASTGRLSSDHPNLQNIPIRTANGRLIRKGFVAKDDFLLLSVDYSQIELRILAHFSQDPTMVKAFKNNQDIHTQTAAEIFNISLDSVKSEQRYKAKAINFGLMYGQSAFGLSETLNISRTDAAEYIEKYFTNFSKVKVYLDSLVEECQISGHTKTMFNRKRYLPDINSNNRQVKSSAERVAINTPIQGTAADIIKKAMIDIDNKLKQEKLNSSMLLQVHDELIFEVDPTELDIMKEIITTSMENVVKLKVPLKVDMGIGKNWFDLK
jgi:DNA polymerase I